jgi:hypothetical protein
MVTITPPTPILDPSPAIRRAVVDYQLAWVAHRATLRDHGKTQAECEAASEAVDRARANMEATIPMALGWYPINGRLWGWSKVDWSGLTLVNRPDRCNLPR